MSRKKQKSRKAGIYSASKKTTKGIKLNRRSFKKLATVFIFSIPIFAAVFAYSKFHQRTYDLGIIGNGKPVLVQAHDTTCAPCRNLQSSVMSVIDEYPEIEYKVANLNSREGSVFARKHGAQIVTLLFFNSKGERVGIQSGIQTEDQVRTFIERYL